MGQVLSVMTHSLSGLCRVIGNSPIRMLVTDSDLTLCHVDKLHSYMVSVGRERTVNI